VALVILAALATLAEAASGFFNVGFQCGAFNEAFNDARHISLLNAGLTTH
jgi:hypothetical protein